MRIVVEQFLSEFFFKVEDQSPTPSTSKGVEIVDNVMCLDLLDSLSKAESVNVHSELGAKINEIRQDLLKNKRILSSVEHKETATFVSADLQRRIRELLQSMEDSSVSGKGENVSSNKD